MSSISPFLWFDTEAEEAAEFYVSVFPNSAIHHVGRNPGSDQAMSVSFSLDGLEFNALNAGPQFPFTEAVSFFISVDDQSEIDRLWAVLTSDGGEPGRCGWLKDRFGLSWQVVPPALGRLLGSSDPAASARVMKAMLGMSKLDIAALEAAAAG